ncbi:MAG: threonine/serine exporter family protein [Defluviitaleaceae bacterium]|nr:threonine/serine exporter family protein [Defluviitaleaceae bacterium]
MMLQILLAFAGTVGFSIIFNVPRRELALCGIAGACGWFVLQLTMGFIPNAGVADTFFAAMAVTCISRIFSFMRKMPVTVYMIPGIIPLVPGTGIYHTMFNAIMGDYTEALLWGIQTLRTAGVIAVGLLVVLTLPPKLFSFVADACINIFAIRRRLRR